MRSSILSRSLAVRWKSILVTAGGLFLIAILFAALFESVAEDLGAFTESIPEGMEAFIGDVARASTPAGWLGIELYALFVPLVVTITGVVSGSGIIGKEEERGTLELLFASPLRRSAILAQKAAALLTQLLIISGAVWLGVLTGTLLFAFDVSLVNVLWATMMGWLLGLTFAFLAFMIQAVTGRKSRASGISAGLLVATYFAHVISQLVESMEPLRFASPFYYYDGQEVLLDGLNLLDAGLLILLPVLFYTIAHSVFKRRDIGV